MSTIAVIWAVLFLLFTALSKTRSIWGFAVYLMTFYASPLEWWWGDGVLQAIGIRWNLVASIIFLLAVILDSRPKIFANSFRWLFVALAIYSANALFVHFAWADNPEHSWVYADQIWKNCLLAFLLVTAIRDWQDLRLAFLFIVMGSAYVGYEVVFNGEGRYYDGRLDNIWILGINGANAVATVFSFAIPLGVYHFLYGQGWRRLAILPPLVLVAEVIARCVSRGNMVGWVLFATVFLILSKGQSRRRALIGFAVCVLTVIGFMGPEHRAVFATRFASIFVEEEQRDASAQSRVNFSVLALKMIGDYPLGSGGEAAFKSDLGMEYLVEIGEVRQRSCHNGYLDIASSWGIQGLVLYLGTQLAMWLKVACASRRVHDQLPEMAFVGYCLCAMLSLQLVCCSFGSFLDIEQFFWWLAFGAALLRLVEVASQREDIVEFDDAVTAADSIQLAE